MAVLVSTSLFVIDCGEADDTKVDIGVNSFSIIHGRCGFLTTLESEETGNCLINFLISIWSKGGSRFVYCVRICEQK